MTGAHLLGFDLRLDPAAASGSWNDDRRRRFLLRADVVEPLSVDPMVWPSRFWQPHVPPGMGIPRHVGTVAVPDGTPGYTPLGLWSDLVSLRAFAAGADVELVPERLVAIVTWLGDRAPHQRRGSDRVEPEGWARLGFDVADQSLVSGLVNCGYDPTERDGLVAGWSGRLNGHGLLDALDAAIAFRDLADARVPEHAPFVVFELRTPAATGKRGMV